MSAAVIDMWAPIVPVPEVMRHTVDNFPDEMLGYLRVFYKTEPTQAAFRARAGAIATPLDDVIAALDAAGIARTLITGFDERSSCGKTFIPNEIVADVVARDFPELKIVMSHAGYPWVLEAVLLAWKYPNVYLELAAHRPKYLAEPGTGWEPLLRFGQNTIADKVLFGTGWFLLGRPPVDIVAEFRALPVKPAVMDRWLGGNAARLLGAA